MLVKGGLQETWIVNILKTNLYMSGVVISSYLNGYEIKMSV